MRIGIDARILGESGGVGAYIQFLAESLSACFPEDELILFVREKNLSHPVFCHSNIRAVRAEVPIYSFAEQWRLKKILEKERLDVLHIPHWNGPIFYQGNIVVTVHDVIPLWFTSSRRTRLAQWVRKKYFRWVLVLWGKRARRIIAISELTREDLVHCAGIDPQKISVIYSGLPEQAAYEEAGKIPLEGARREVAQKFKINNPYFFASNIWRTHKNLSGLIQAFRSLPDGSMELIIGGIADKNFPDVENLFREHVNSERVKFLGLLSSHDQALLERGACACVLPSFVEGFGFFFVEALLSGARLISSERVGAKEVIGGDVEFFNPGSIRELTALLEQAQKNNAPPQEMFWLKKVSWHETAQKTHQVYEEVLRGQ